MKTTTTITKDRSYTQSLGAARVVVIDENCKYHSFKSPITIIVHYGQPNEEEPDPGTPETGLDLVLQNWLREYFERKG